VTFLLFRTNPSRELLPGAVVTQATLWATFTVILATLISNVTFHLRRSVARARRLGQYTLLEKIGEGGMGVVYRAEHEMLRRPTTISPADRTRDYVSTARFRDSRDCCRKRGQRARRPARTCRQSTRAAPARRCPELADAGLVTVPFLGPA